MIGQKRIIYSNLKQLSKRILIHNMSELMIILLEDQMGLKVGIYKWHRKMMEVAKRLKG